MEREDPLDADAARDLAHGEGLARAAAAAGDDHALEDLDPLLVALVHPHVDADRVARRGTRACSPQIGALDLIQLVHDSPRKPDGAARGRCRHYSLFQNGRASAACRSSPGSYLSPTRLQFPALLRRQPGPRLRPLQQVGPLLPAWPAAPRAPASGGSPRGRPKSAPRGPPAPRPPAAGCSAGGRAGRARKLSCSTESASSTTPGTWRDSASISTMAGSSPPDST